MPNLSYLPAWRTDFSYRTSNPIVRTVGAGYSRQARKSHRVSYRGSATRILKGTQLPYFEYFVRDVCADGSLKFTDYYFDGSGVQQGSIRIVNGEYQVSALSKSTFEVSCDIEVYR